MGPIGCPETSVSNYHYSLRKNAEERSSQVKLTPQYSPSLEANSSSLKQRATFCGTGCSPPWAQQPATCQFKQQTATVLLPVHFIITHTH